MHQSDLRMVLWDHIVYPLSQQNHYTLESYIGYPSEKDEQVLIIEDEVNGHPVGAELEPIHSEEGIIYGCKAGLVDGFEVGSCFEIKSSICCECEND